MTASSTKKWKTWIASVPVILVISQSASSFVQPSMTAIRVMDIINQSDVKRDPIKAIISIGDYFTENRGQVSGIVRYYSKGNPSVGFRNDGVMFVLTKDEELRNSARRLDSMDSPYLIDYGPMPLKSQAYFLRFDGANEITPVGQNRVDFASNFLVGSKSAGWRIGVPNYREVAYRNLYDGIDLAYRATSDGIKYEFFVHPGADLNKIVMDYEGVEAIEIVDSGIVVHTVRGEVRDSRPYAYQETTGEVACAFVMRGETSYGFECPGMNKTETLTIDPLIFSTFLGGSDNDAAGDTALDLSGSVYAVGGTLSGDFPVTPGAFDASYDNIDCIVSKLTPDGSSLMYSTYLGGSEMDICWSIDVDSSGSSYITGRTESGDFPTSPGAFSDFFNGGGSDAFVTRLNATGSGLVYSTFLGGSDGSEAGLSITVNARECAFVTGSTSSTNFPTTAGVLAQSNNGFTDAFVTMLNPSGSDLLYSTYLGGAAGENGFDISIDSTDYAYITGWTESVDFPTTPGAFDVTYNGGPPTAPHDEFVTKLNPMGSKAIFSTFLGGSGRDDGLSITVDPYGFIYVAGNTDSADFPITPGSFDNSLNGNEDAFVIKLNPSGDGLTYSTFLGGGGIDHTGQIAIDISANVYLVGGTTSSDFPVTFGAFDASLNGSADAFIIEMNSNGSALLYSTLLGGNDFDAAGSIAVDSVGNIFVAGETCSADFPATAGAYDLSYNGNGDAFVTKMGSAPTPDLPDLTISSPDISFNPPGPVVLGGPIDIGAMIRNVGKVNASQVNVRFHDGVPPSAPKIDSDQSIPFIEHSGGTGVASVVWLAKPPGVHEVCVVADPDNLIAESDETNNIACRQVEVVFSLQLTPGHRFMSFPVAVADDGIAQVLSSIAGCYDYVRWYDPLDALDHWKSFAPGRAYNDLTHLDNKMGFWINITATCSFTPAGMSPMSTTINLHQGWNMVGFPSYATTYTVADLKADIGLAGAMVEAFDASAIPYYLQRVPDSHVMMAGEGYWVYVPSDAMWIVDG